MLFPYLYEFIEIMVQKGITNVVISPGSRSAPLTIAFARHPEIQKFIVPDERSAGFIALGMALATQKPVGLLCTSGSAVVNYFPAVSEAFFQEIPLLILTADRPSEWLNQKDGQTIFQKNVFGNHVKASFEFPIDFQHPDATWYANRISNDATNVLLTAPFQPVHINIPLREPLYPTDNEEIIFKKEVRLIEKSPTESIISEEFWHKIIPLWQKSDKKMLIVGQMILDKNILDKIQKLQQKGVVVLSDAISNTQNAENREKVIKYHDWILMQNGEGGQSQKEILKKLAPNLVFTIGKSLISKSLKEFIRKNPPAYHWHIQPAGEVSDMFRCLTHSFEVEPIYFLDKLLNTNDLEDFDNSNDLKNTFQKSWWEQEKKATQFLNITFDTFEKNNQNIDNELFSEFEATKIVLENLVENSKLHLANSMPVRYVNFLGLPENKNIEVFANRGTSGIDGSSSTALGYATQTSETVVLFTGDIAFFYDRNAFWNDFVPKNLRIILMNNHAGNIFRLIDAKNSPELETYFETSNPLNAKGLAQEMKMEYFFAENANAIKIILKNFFEPSDTAKILEIKTDKYQNAEVWQQLKNDWLNFAKI
jgi:2-succinyl-5-enolpyruvyl-6-hydroxy-3-cyclohexene-1-carboxylate synthase